MEALKYVFLCVGIMAVVLLVAHCPLAAIALLYLGISALR